MTEPHYCLNCGAEAIRDHEGIVKHQRTHARHCDLDDEGSLEAKIDD